MPNALVLLGPSTLAIGLVAGFVVVLALFVLFLPDSSYLITELGHLGETSRDVPA